MHVYVHVTICAFKRDAPNNEPFKQQADLCLIGEYMYMYMYVLISEMCPVTSEYGMLGSPQVKSG